MFSNSILNIVQDTDETYDKFSYWDHCLVKWIKSIATFSCWRVKSKGILSIFFVRPYFLEHAYLGGDFSGHVLYLLKYL